MDDEAVGVHDFQEMSTCCVPDGVVRAAWLARPPVPALAVQHAPIAVSTNRDVGQVLAVNERGKARAVGAMVPALAVGRSAWDDWPLAKVHHANDSCAAFDVKVDVGGQVDWSDEVHTASRDQHSAVGVRSDGSDGGHKRRGVVGGVVTFRSERADVVDGCDGGREEN